MVTKQGTGSLRPESTADSSRTQTKTTSTTSSGFEAQATKNGIRLSTNSKPPTNTRHLISRLNQPRESVSPTESIFEDHVDTITKAPNEATTSHETAPLLKGYRGRGYARAWNQAFTAYPKNVGFNNGLSAPQPDFVQGFRQLEFEPFPVGDELDSAVLYHDDQNSIALPHLAGEWKGPGNNMDQAALQSAYDGAALVHSRNEALAYLGTPDPAGHAAVLTVTTDGRAVNVFGHHVVAPPTRGDHRPQYHQYRLTAAHMDESYDDFKKGRKHLRNAQDFARDQASLLRGQLQDYWKTRRPATPAGCGRDDSDGETERDPDQAVPPDLAAQPHRTTEQSLSGSPPPRPGDLLSGGPARGGKKRRATSPSSWQFSRAGRGTG